jgi:hypothetical protein
MNEKELKQSLEILLKSNFKISKGIDKFLVGEKNGFTIVGPVGDNILLFSIGDTPAKYFFDTITNPFLGRLIVAIGSKGYDIYQRRECMPQSINYFSIKRPEEL